MAGPSYHGWTHRPKLRGGSDPVPFDAHYEIIVVEEDEPLAAGNGQIHFPIPEDLDGWYLVSAHAGIQAVSTSGNVEVMYRNAGDDKAGTTDMLTTAVTIQTGDLTSYQTGSTAGVINTSNDQVATGDFIAVDVDADGTGVLGLIAILTFSMTSL